MNIVKDMSGGAMRGHSTIISNINSVLGYELMLNDSLCHLYGEGMRYLLNESYKIKRLIEPDVFIVCEGKFDKKDRYIITPPDFVVEVVSPSSIKKILNIN